MILIKKTERKSVGSQGQKTRYAIFQCEKCSNTVEIPYGRGLTQKTCGCEVEHHNQSNTSLYNVWSGIKRRCYNKKQKSYAHYGAKGVEMCREWKESFIAFRDWAIKNGYKKGLEISRNGDIGNYSPENVTIKTKFENGSEAHTGRVMSDNQKWQYTQTVTGLEMEEIDEMIEAATSGELKQSEIAISFGVDRHTIARVVRRAGYEPKYLDRAFNTIEVKKIREDRPNNTIKELVNKYGTNHETMSCVVNERGSYAR